MTVVGGRWGRAPAAGCVAKRCHRSKRCETMKSEGQKVVAGLWDMRLDAAVEVPAPARGLRRGAAVLRCGSSCGAFAAGVSR